MSVLMVELVPMKAMPYDLHHIKPHRLIWADPSIQGDNTDIHIIFKTYLFWKHQNRYQSLITHSLLYHSLLTATNHDVYVIC